MKLEKKHIEFYKHLDLQYAKTNNQLWHAIESQLHAVPPAPRLKLRFKTYAAVATLALLIGLVGFLNLYTTSVYSPRAGRAHVSLPDGSTIALNADTYIRYKPFWWYINREVELEGEGFFEVTKGSKFTILSEYGKTEILGTSFNIYARKKTYEVFCKTGKVKVSSPLDSKAFLIKPGQLVKYTANYSTVETTKPNEESISSWRDNIFTFNSEKLDRVIDELEVLYDIDIQNTVQESEYTYTGLFNKNMEAEDVLEILCKSFNLKLKKISSKRYKIY